MAGKRYAPISVHLAHGRTGMTLMERHGAHGLLVWVCLILAAKRSLVPGQYIHMTDAETWGNFGLLADPPPFTFEEFLTTTGHLKQTARTRHGHLLYVTLTRFGDWNKEWGTQQASLQKSRKRAESIPDSGRTRNWQKPDTTRTEYEVEVEVEREVEEPPLTPPPAAPRKREPDPLWDAVVELCGEVSNGNRKRRGLVVSELRDMGATAADVYERYPLIQQRWPTITVTDTTLVKYWGIALKPLPPGEKQRSATLIDDINRSAAEAMMMLGHSPKGTYDLELEAGDD